MGFADVYEEEVNLVFAFLVPVFDVTDIATKGASGVGSENQRRRTPRQVRKRDLALPILGVEGEVGRRLSRIRSTEASLSQARARHGKNQ